VLLRYHRSPFTVGRYRTVAWSLGRLVTRVCASICKRVYSHLRSFACVLVRVCVRSLACACKHTQANTSEHKRMCLLVRVFVCVLVCAHTRARRRQRRRQLPQGGLAPQQEATPHTTSFHFILLPLFLSTQSSKIGSL
jgi:hypothetical protein